LGGGGIFKNREKGKKIKLGQENEKFKENGKGVFGILGLEIFYRISAGEKMGKSGGGGNSSRSGKR